MTLCNQIMCFIIYTLMCAYDFRKTEGNTPRARVLITGSLNKGFMTYERLV